MDSIPESALINTTGCCTARITIEKVLKAVSSTAVLINSNQKPFLFLLFSRDNILMRIESDFD